MCAVAILFYVKMLERTKRYAVVGGKTRPNRPQPLGRLRPLAVGYVGLWALVAVVLPMVTLIWVALVPYFQLPSAAAFASFTTEAFYEGYLYLLDPLRNTAILVIGSVTLCLCISLCLSWIVTRSGSRAARWADSLVFLAPAVPTMVAAIAFQIAAISISDLVPIYGTIALLVIAMSTRMLTYCTRTLNGASLQLHPELFEGARVAGLSRFAVFRGIFIPLARPAIFYSALMVGMLAARDLTLPLLLLSGQTQTVSTRIFELQTNGDQNTAAAIAIYMVVLLATIAVLAQRITLARDADDNFSRRRRSLAPIRRQPSLVVTPAQQESES